MTDMPLPPLEGLPDLPELPDPFMMASGLRVRTDSDWAARREEMLALLLHYQYGHMPPSPGNVDVLDAQDGEALDGLALTQRVILQMGPGVGLTLRALLTHPAGDGPFPVIIKNDHGWEAVPALAEVIGRGYAVVEYLREDLSEDNPSPLTRRPAADLYPDYDWGTLAMWAWGTHRIIDWLEEIEFIDSDSITTTGHSRGGKAALLAGATDGRIGLTVPNGSGTGGAGCYRVPVGETLEHITTAFPHWFTPRFGDFAGHETRLPFDQHFLKALVAPGHLLSVDAYGDEWANPPGTQQTYLAAAEVYDWLDVGEHIGIHVRQGGHDQTAEDWRTLLDFADWCFRDKRPAWDFSRLPFPEQGPSFSWRRPE